MILLLGDNVESLNCFGPKAYPHLFFHDDVLSNVAALDGGYLSSRQIVRRALAILDDNANWIFTRPPPTLSFDDAYDASSEELPSNQIIEARFRGAGLVVAPENPNVHDDLKCRKSREISVAGQKLYCHWHVKLELHRNRIHIHAPISGTGDKTLVGIIKDHLPLP